MRGLAFPTNTVVDREASYEYGTPISNVDEIPIDPALSGAPIDPALMVDDSSTNFVQTQQEIHDIQHQEVPPEDYQMRQYSQGPQGDPFAPQLPPPFFPIEQQQLLPTPKPKRKRRIRREEECGFCQGNDTRNTMGDPELMLTCHMCGRSGHPSCMHLAKQAEVVRSYEWKCIECKNCELCKEKGDDERILFCDGCDRGWHLDCMVPPLETPPEGAWHCPACPDIIPEGQEYTNSAHQPEEIKSQSPFFTAKRETSIASTSRSVVQVRASTRGRGRKRGVGRARGGAPRVAVTSENYSDGEEVETLALSRARGRMKSNGKGKARSATPSSDEELTVSPIRPLKRKRTRQLSPVLPLPRVRLRLPPRGKGKGREEEETSHGLFDEILGSAERDTSKTSITNLDKTYFERSRLSAEDKLAPPPPPTATSSRTLDAAEFSSPMHRPLRSATLHHIPSRIDLSNSPAPSTPGGPLPKLELGVLRIRSIRFGQYDIKTWYDAPFPEEYASIPDGRLWICEFCLKYMKSRFGAFRHRMKCHARNPPGDEIYRDGAISIFEVDGRRNKIYCQNLCLLSKMFLDHKSLFYDVEPFLFYVITETDEFGARFVGYFSKEKRCPKEYNLSCIMTLPVRQRQGWGNLLVDFSYLLSKIEQRLGSPEKPLSSLGALSYKNYWTLAIMRFLRSTPENVPVRLQDISTGTSMTMEDVYNTLVQLNMIFVGEASPPPIRPSPGQTIKFPKGRKNGIARKHLQRMQTQDKELDGVKAPFVIPKNYEIQFDRTKVEEYLSNWESKGYLKLKPEKLQWTPYIMTRNPKEPGVNVDLPAMDTVTHDNSRMQFINGPSAESVAEPVSESVSESVLELFPEFAPEPVPDSVANSTADLVIEAVEEPMTESIAEPSTKPVTPSPGAVAVDSPAPMCVVDDDELPVIAPSTPSTSRSRVQSSTESSVKPSVTSKSTSPSLSSVFSRPPPPRTLRSGRSQTKYGSPAMRIDAESTPVRSTKSRPPKRRPSRKVDTEDDDEALAAKLAKEEQVQGRQLRSRGSESQLERKRAATPVSIPKVPPGRKRRRIESSPETSKGSPATEAEEIHLNGKGLSPAPMIMEPDVSKVNGKHCYSGGDECQSETQTLEVADGINVEPKGDMVLKTENGGTPFPSFASRPSHAGDDTIFMTEVHVHMEKSSNNFADFRGAVHAESDLRSTLGPDEWLDEDADGEYDEDAEGEADEVGYYCANHPGQFQPNPFRKLSSVARFLYGPAGAKVSVHPLERLSFSENTDHAAPAPINSEAAMQYAHMGLQDRRDQNLDGSGSANFHQNGGLGQALGGGHINPGAAYTRTTEYRNPSTSPPTLTQAGTSHAGPSSNHSPLTFAVAGQSPAMKRKQVDGSMNNQTQKRRRETAGGGDEGDSYDMDGNAQGAKHWTDEEKSKLFTWLMGAGQEEHWNSLRATKNSCLRECATEVFGGKKTYQALKGCYERNFNLFKQIYAFETAHGQAGGNTNLAGLSEADRLREYERRLQIARKAGSDVGNITARTIDHWHRVGWYDLFYRRWHGDPATTRPIQGRTSGVGVGNNMNGGQVGGDDPDDEGPMLDFSDPSTMNNLNGMSHDRQHVFINPQNLPNDIPNSIPNSIPNPGLRTPGQMPPPPVPEIPVLNLPITQDMVARGLHLIHLQTQVAQEKLEYLRRREAREISEFTQRKDAVDKANMTRHKFERAIDLLSSAHADPSLKHVTTEYLTNLTKLLLGQD